MRKIFFLHSMILQTKILNTNDEEHIHHMSNITWFLVGLGILYTTLAQCSAHNVNPLEDQSSETNKAIHGKLKTCVARCECFRFQPHLHPPYFVSYTTRLDTFSLCLVFTIHVWRKVASLHFFLNEYSTRSKRENDDWKWHLHCSNE